eukprot:TRINITY_DN12238_c0_g1_i1.p3 TRINITY_DN12238_c0_g1~~TRINITY_DN12238_c0_g1_i1.p3  ORF type:complete len:310 (-),score=81.09 TRINITY_DN12238_c0_g1_i1:69-998(-)
MGEKGSRDDEAAGVAERVGGGMVRHFWGMVVVVCWREMSERLDANNFELFKKEREGWKHGSERLVEVLKMAGTSFVCCSALHGLAFLVFKRKIPEPIWEMISEEDKIHMAERIVSTVHGVGVSVATMYSLFWKKDFQRSLTYEHPKRCDYIFSASLGYSLYDMVTMKALGNEPTNMWVHHIMMMYGCFLVLNQRLATFYPFAFLTTEITVLGENLNWYVRKVGMTKSPVFYNLFKMRVFLYLAFRLFVGPVTVAYALQRREFAQIFKDPIPKWLTAILVLNMSVISKLNVQWTQGLLQQYAKYGIPAAE